MTARRRRRQAGASMIEVLAAISLFALVAAAVATLTGQSIRRTIENKHGTQAALIAQDQLEQMRGLDYDDIAASNGTVVHDGQQYDVTTNVQDGVPDDGMKTITVTVDWTGPEGAKSYEIETIYTAVRS